MKQIILIALITAAVVLVVTNVLDAPGWVTLGASVLDGPDVLR